MMAHVKDCTTRLHCTLAASEDSLQRSRLLGGFAVSAFGGFAVSAFGSSPDSPFRGGDSGVPGTPYLARAALATRARD